MVDGIGASIDPVTGRRRNDPSSMAQAGVSTTSINDIEYQNELERINKEQSAGNITQEQANRERIEARKTWGDKNIDIMKKGGVSDTSINDQMLQDKLVLIDMNLQAGFISQEDAMKQIAEARHDHGIQNIDIMRNSGMVSQESISDAQERNEEEYQNNLQRLSMRGSDQNQGEGLLANTEDIFNTKDFLSNFYAYLQKEHGFKPPKEMVS